MSKPEPQIQLYFHCKRCLDELPEGLSPQEWAQLEAGWTNKGLQVWCKRHGINVIHIDFATNTADQTIFGRL